MREYGRPLRLATLTGFDLRQHLQSFSATF
jgi:hypothetical protein